VKREEMSLRGQRTSSNQFANIEIRCGMMGRKNEIQNLHPSVALMLEELKAYAPERVILFGSHARVDTHQGSDIDVLIIKETERKFLDRILDVYEICRQSPRIEAIVYTPAEFEQKVREGCDFIQTALEEGIVIYEKQQSERSEPRGTNPG
jgi:predicted nucleotidyltransferase